MLSADAIKELGRMSEQAAGIRTVPLPAEPPHVYGLYNSRSGTYERCVAEPHPRAGTALRLSDVRTLVADRLKEAPSEHIHVWCGQGQVHVVFDARGTRRGGCKLVCPVAEQFARLEQLAEEPEMLDQRAFIDLLRVDLAGAVPIDFIGMARRLKFTSNASGAGDVRQGRESFDRSVLLEVVADGADLPETINVTVPVYEDLQDDTDVYETVVECVFRLNAHNDTLGLLPLKDSLKAARRKADEWILSRLTSLVSDQVLVVCGSPQ